MTEVGRAPPPIPLPRRGRGSRRGGTYRPSGAEGRGGTRRPSAVEGRAGTHSEARGGVSGPPLTLPSPPKGRGKEERAPRAGVTEAEAPRAGMTKAGHAPPPIPLPRRGRGSRRRPERSASGAEGRGGTRRPTAVEGRAGTHSEARGGASVPPHPPLSPQGERERRTRTPRGGDRSGGAACGNDRGGARTPSHSSPHRGRGSRRRPERSASGAEGRGGDAPRKRSRRQRGDAPPKRSRRKSGDALRGSRWRQRPPSPSPLPPRGEGDKNEQRARGVREVRASGSSPCNYIRQGQ
jgi:hypothetical protein